MVRGLPGSGKTTFIEDLIAHDIYATFLSFDQLQDKALLDLTVENNQLLLDKLAKEFEAELNQGTDHIVIEGFSENELVEAYKDKATSYGYQFTSIIVENRHLGKSVNSWHDSDVLIEAQSNFSIQL